MVSAKNGAVVEILRKNSHDSMECIDAYAATTPLAPDDLVRSLTLILIEQAQRQIMRQGAGEYAIAVHVVKNKDRALSADLFKKGYRKGPDINGYVSYCLPPHANINEAA